MRNFDFWAVIIIAKLSVQQCEDVTFSARYPCVFHFTLNTSDHQSTCSFSSCDSKFISKPSTYTDWSECYLYCCPGIVPPLTSTLDSLRGCSDYFSSTPTLSYVIGMAIGLILCLLYIILPCCTTQFCPLYKLRHKVYDLCLTSKQEQSQKFDSNLRSLGGESNPTHINPLASIDKIALQNEALNFSLMTNENICRLCNEDKATIKLKCGHNFHKDCLIKRNEDLKQCSVCHSRQTTPLTIICSKCHRKYKTSDCSILQADYVCKQC